MRYIYSDSKLICIDSIATVEMGTNEVFFTLNSGKTINVYSSHGKNSEDDVISVFMELTKEIRRNEEDICMFEFKNYISWYRGVEDGTWFI
jgi:hypothetical protein